MGERAPERAPIADAYLFGWRAGHRELRRMALALVGTAITNDEIEALAANEARLFMEDRMERDNLTWREGVHHFFSYFDGYKDGARLRLTMQSARSQMLRGSAAHARRLPSAYEG